MKEDGTPDKRVGTGQFAQGKVDPHEAGAQGGKASGGSANYDEDDDSTSGNSGGKGGKGQFAGGKVDPVEAGRKGGKSSGNSDE
ncbi:hypothetical protein ONS96_007450 [Cadophora gregata f. sp. sojae]|nr:hypothetical protein ONS96_007450 [Cadophora gregata f. sp. sojae]